jgi:hypothetical protein
VFSLFEIGSGVGCLRTYWTMNNENEWWLWEKELREREGKMSIDQVKWLQSLICAFYTII